MTTEQLLQAWRAYEAECDEWDRSRPLGFRGPFAPRNPTVVERAGSYIARHGTAAAALAEVKSTLHAYGSNNPYSRELAVLLAKAAQGE